LLSNSTVEKCLPERLYERIGEHFSPYRAEIPVPRQIHAIMEL